MPKFTKLCPSGRIPHSRLRTRRAGLDVPDVKLGLLLPQEPGIATEVVDDKYIVVDGVVLSVEWSDRPDQHTVFRKLAIRAAGGPNMAVVAVRLTESECAIAVGSTGAPPRRLLCTEAAW
jgi:hypothetical protein